VQEAWHALFHALRQPLSNPQVTANPEIAQSTSWAASMLR
jgi:hypothetical protein